MTAEQSAQDSRSREKARAKFRMALWLLAFFGITLFWAFLTFPFLGFSSSIQNVVHGVLVASPFWVAVLAALVKIRRQTRR